MKPSEKSPEMEKALDEMTEAMFGTSRTKAIKGDTCVICRGPATEFKDTISQREYQISGMCQECQDKTFG